jgi:hypothetical protein
MMEQYQLFDAYLQKSKAIRAFCEKREQLLFECIRMSISTDGKIHWLETVGREVDAVASLIEALSADRKPPLSLNG